MFKAIKILFLFALWLMPALASAQGNLPEKIFPAEVVEIVKEEKAPASNGGLMKQQDLKLKGLEGEYKDKVIEYKGIGMPEMIQKNVYERGDKVLVEAGFDDKGGVVYFITDYYRLSGIFWLSVIFILSLLVIGRWKGVRSLIALALTFVVIMKYILPQIIDGADPIAVTLIGSLVILLLIIYTTEGFRVSSHLTIASILLSLVLTVMLSWIFVGITQLSGLANEEASFLIGLGDGQIVNFKGLLLAGIIIGALGVLDDVVVSQVTAVKEIYDADPSQSRTQLFKKAFNIGTSHISSMTNTLFLAYAGASLPLLILFLSGQSAFSSSVQALNNETLATEIVRTLAGSIGLISAVPVSTLLATLWFKK
ncbi:MAG: YibE/F family protein [Patescibacteria group bacterium]